MPRYFFSHWDRHGIAALARVASATYGSRTYLLYILIWNPAPKRSRRKNPGPGTGSLETSVAFRFNPQDPSRREALGRFHFLRLAAAAVVVLLLLLLFVASSRRPFSLEQQHSSSSVAVTL